MSRRWFRFDWLTVLRADRGFYPYTLDETMQAFAWAMEHAYADDDYAHRVSPLSLMRGGGAHGGKFDDWFGLGR